MTVRPQVRVRKPTSATYQAMEALVHNLNTMHSRAGAQMPFSLASTTARTPRPRAAWSSSNLLLATEAGLGNGETPDLPDSYFQGQGRRQLQPGRPELRPVQAGHAAFRPSACSRTSRSWTRRSTCSITSRAIRRPRSPTWAAARALWPTCTIRPVRLPTAAATCRFTSINLPRIAITQPRRSWTGSSRSSTARSTSSSTSCSTASKSSAASACATIPFLMGQGVWLDSEKLGPDDEVGEVLKHGTLTHRLHRSGRVPQGAHRRTPRRERRGAEPWP